MDQELLTMAGRVWLSVKLAKLGLTLTVCEYGFIGPDNNPVSDQEAIEGLMDLEQESLRKQVVNARAEGIRMTAGYVLGRLGGQ